MSKKIVVVCGFLNEKHRQQILAAAGKYGYTVEFFKNNDEALDAVRDAEIIYAAATGGGHKLAQQAKNLKWFCSISAGVDALLKPAILADGCQLSNSSGAYGLTIAEHMIMVTLMLLRRYPEYDDIVRQHEWQSGLPLRSIKDSRITILGAGDIGTRYAERLRPFEPAKIVGVSRSGKKRSDVYDEVIAQDKIDDVLPQTDVLAMCLPGTSETDNMISKERLALLPRDAFLINVGRGNALDEDALVEALNSDQLAGAAIDVMKKEPLPKDSVLWTAKNIIITPHCSGKMTLQYTRDKSVAMFCEDLANFVAGKKLLRNVDRKLGY